MEPIIRAQSIPEWTVGILFVSLGLLAMSKWAFEQRHSSFLNLLNDNSYIFVFNKKKAYLHPFHWTWNLFAILNTSLFFYLSTGLGFENQAYLSNGAIHYGPLLVVVAGFVILKPLLQNFHGWLFGNQKILKEIFFKKSSYFNYANVVLFTANIFFVFISPNSKVLFYSALFLFLMVMLIGWVVVLRNYQKYLLEHLFYFILYLCALEIAPFLIIASIFNS